MPASFALRLQFSYTLHSLLQFCGKRQVTSIKEQLVLMSGGGGGGGRVNPNPQIIDTITFRGTGTEAARYLFLRTSAGKRQRCCIFALSQRQNCTEPLSALVVEPAQCGAWKDQTQKL